MGRAISRPKKERKSLKERVKKELLKISLPLRKIYYSYNSVIPRPNRFIYLIIFTY